jgi:hypothetical protein
MISNQELLNGMPAKIQHSERRARPITVRKAGWKAYQQEARKL